MRLTGPRGFSLPELMAVLVLTAVVGTVIVRSTLMLGRTTRAQQERGIVEAAFDQSADYLVGELASVSRGDVLRISTESVTYRAIRLTGYACLVAGTEIRILRDRLTLVRQPQPGRDSLLIHAGPDPLGARTGEWVGAPILGVSNAACGSRPALGISTTIDSATVATGVSRLVPVRSFEVMEARFYSSQGSIWLGARSESTGESIQPLAGPFEAPGTGFEFLDSAGTATTVPAAVRTVTLRFAGTAPGWGGLANGYQARAGATLAPENLGP